MIRTLWTLVVGLLLSAPAIAAEPITMEDLLGAESLDASYSGSAFSPDGRTLAYAVTAARTKRPTWGYDSAEFQTMSRVFVTSIEGGAPREIEGSDEVLYSLAHGEAWAPDGGSLLLVATTPRSYGLARYDLASGEITELPGRIRDIVPPLAWTPEGRLVYATGPDDARQRRSWAQMLDDLYTRWNATWTGRDAAVTVHSANPVFAATAEKPGALLLADTKGRVQTIAEGDYTLLGISTSPTGRHVAAIASRERLTDAVSPTGRRGELQIFALTSTGATMAHRLETLDVAAYDEPAWSPSGDAVLVVGRPPGGDESDTNLYVVDAKDGTYRTIDAPGLSLMAPALTSETGRLPSAWLGDTPIAVAVHAAEGAESLTATGASREATYHYGQAMSTRADIFAFGAPGPENLTSFAKGSVQDFVVADASLLAVADGALWSLAPGRAPEKLTADDAPPVLGFGVDPRYVPASGQSAYYKSGDVERVSLLTLANGAPERAIFDLVARSLEPLDVAGKVVATAPDRRTVLARVEDGWSATFVLDDGEPRTLVTVNEGLKSRSVAPIEKFTYQVGESALDGYVVWPADAKPDAKPPAVVFVYGGVVWGQPPSFAGTTPVFSPIFSSGQLLAAQGYAVIYPSTPLGAGRDSDQPQQLAEAVVAAIDAVAAGGRIDTSRIGVMGQSYGGFSTAALLAKRSDRFKAGISLAGLYDFFHAYGARELSVTFSDAALDATSTTSIEEGQGQLGKPFWETPEAYIRNSPIFDVETMDSPLLMLHGDLDLGETDVQAAERMYVALVRAGKQPVLVHYWGEGHLASSAPAIRDQWTRITTWFDHYLKDEP